MRSILAAAALAFNALPLTAQPAPAPPAPAAPNTGFAAILAEAGTGTRWGVLVVDPQGQEIAAIDADRRFMPASNTKLFTTAAALWAEARGTAPTLAPAGSGTSVTLAGRDVVLTGRGDPHLSAAPDCIADCLATLADAVAKRTRQVRDVIGDATLFPDERWSPGMSWNNIPTSSGTAIAALIVNDNELPAIVGPGAPGAPPAVIASRYFAIDNRATTGGEGGGTLAYDRFPGSRALLVTGAVTPGAAAETWRLGIDDPAHFAAWQLAELLRARGVRVTGTVHSRYRPAGTAAPAVPQSPPLATLTAPPLAETVTRINKQSQNLYAELLLRRLGLAGGGGAIADGQAVVTAMLGEAGVAPGAVSLSDGSGMSSYNRVSPRATLALLRWAARQPWAATYRASLPVGGVDGTLRRRFAGTPLAGRIFAKTGTLNATNALAGWLIAASGRELTFAIYANDVPEGVAATAIMDRALLALAAAN